MTSEKTLRSAVMTIESNEKRSRARSIAKERKAAGISITAKLEQQQGYPCEYFWYDLFYHDGAIHDDPNQ